MSRARLCVCARVHVCAMLLLMTEREVKWHCIWATGEGGGVGVGVEGGLGWSQTHRSAQEAPVAVAPATAERGGDTGVTIQDRPSVTPDPVRGGASGGP